MNKIEISEGLFLTSDYCAWYKKERTVIVADFHLGYGTVLKEDGMSIPTFQMENILDRLANIKNRYEPDSFIVLGDFKHNFGRSKSQEFNEILDIVDYLMEDCSLIMIKGNHDNYLQNYANIKGVPFYEKNMLLEDMSLTHGHLKIRWEGLQIMGHEHPAIEIKDEVGSKLRLPCFLYHPKREIVVLPAFDPLSEGRNVIESDSFFSKNLEGIKPDNFQIYAISEQGILDFHKVQEVREAGSYFG